MEKREAALIEARRIRSAIAARLEGEDELELVQLLEKCGQPLVLVCTSCGRHHGTETRCRQKWCPVCVRAIATKRSLKFTAAVHAMEWPLFITLTMKNVDDLDTTAVRRLRRAFGKLRHRRIWKENVRGGVAGIEITNIGQGWHPHLHAVVDCRWLSIKTPRPQANESKDSIARKCKAAKHELSRLWAKCLGEPYGVCWVKRAYGDTITQEVLKYSVKGSDLEHAPTAIGPLIHCMRTTRLTTSFGTLFGKLRVTGAESRPQIECEDCGAVGSFVPQEIVDRIIRN